MPPQRPASSCSVAPLAAVSDTQALAFENNAGSAYVIDVSGLTPGTSRALDRLTQMVERFGGTVKLTSAFRPSPYQEHLQAVWDKWRVLRNNREESCGALRAEVGGEFKRHQLLVTQRPVPVSDHTLGIGFDASIMMPIRSRLRRRVTADSLARMAGLRRPDVRHDPVHYRFIGAKG